MTCPPLAAGWAAQADPAPSRTDFKRPPLYLLLSLPGARTQHDEVQSIPRSRRPEMCCILASRLEVFAELETPRDWGRQRPHLKGTHAPEKSRSQTHRLAQTEGSPFFPHTAENSTCTFRNFKMFILSHREAEPLLLPTAQPSPCRTPL